MSYRGFGRGRGYGPQGARTKGPFMRPCFPPFRHIGPPRPGYPGPFMPRHPNNFYQPQLRGNPQFRPRGRGRKFYNDEQYADSNKLPVSLDCEDTIPQLPLSSLNSKNVENSEMDCAPQLFSEEQQQDASEAGQSKQDLCFSGDEIWNTVSFPCDTIENSCTESNDGHELNDEPPELDAVYDELKDMDRTIADNSEVDALQLATSEFSFRDNINNDVLLKENENVSELEEMCSEIYKVTDSENMQDVNDVEKFHESVDDGPYLEQTNLPEANNFANELSQEDLQGHCDALEGDFVQDQSDHQEDFEETETHLKTVVTQKQEASSKAEAPITKSVPLQHKSTNQDTLQENELHDKKEPTSNSETEKLVTGPCIHTTSKSDNTICSVPVSPNSPILNGPASQNQCRLPELQEGSFHSRSPPDLSSSIEPQLPVDFDPSCPPPTLLSQDRPPGLPAFPMYNLPLFNPAEPPPNMRHLVPPNVPAWNINESPMPFNNIEMHRDLNMPVACASQQLPLEMPSQSNVFLPPHLDAIHNFVPVFPLLPPSGHHAMETNIPPPLLLPMQQVSHNAYLPSVSPPDFLPSSESNLDNKDDGLNDIEEAMKFAEQMTNMIEAGEGLTPEDGNMLKPTNDIESISLPPGKPRIRSNKLLRKKRDDACNRNIIVLKEQVASPEEATQDPKSVDEPQLYEQDRPKVIFNLSNKTIKVTNWQPETSGRTRSQVNKKNEQRMRAEIKARDKALKKKLDLGLQITEAPAISPVRTRIAKSTSLEQIKERNKQQGNTSVRDRSNSENKVPAKLHAATTHKKLERNLERSSRVLSLPPQVQMSLRSRMEKNGSSVSEVSWKNKIVNRFLKMSKNEIYNMVNNTSRKFDVVMKRLVKEKRSMMSLEMRHAQDEKMKQDDHQEFMKQFYAMLEPGATVGITDLPTEFIHHLNEVLQMDIPLANNEKPATKRAIIPGGNAEGTSCDVTNPITQVVEHTSKTMGTGDAVDQECVKSKSCVPKAIYVNETLRNAPAHNIKINELATKDDAHSIKSNKSNVSSRFSALQHDLDDIFSEVTRKNQIPTAAARKDCSVGPLRSARRSDDGATSKRSRNLGEFEEREKESWEEDRARRTENCMAWIERCNKWKMKEQEDPLAYRNLTKEEWEAKYGIPAMEQDFAINPVTANILTAIPTAVMRQADINDEVISSRVLANNLYPRRRHSSESSKHSPSRHKTVAENEKHKGHRRHSDERKQVHSENDHHNKSRSSSSSSTSSGTKSSSDSIGTNTNVTKLLRVIKEKEKVAKQMSLNETIRDEVNAEIQRERKQKSKKSRKNRKSRKEKRTRHKKNKKQRKKLPSSSDSSSQEAEGEESNEEGTMRLLTESEIKKENDEDPIAPEVIVKMEANAGQEAGRIREAEPASVLSCANEKSRTSLTVETHARPESASSSRETWHSPGIEDISATTSPTQLKTKAQLKQMPETTETFNKAALPSTESGTFDDSGATNILKHAEISRKYPCSTTHVNHEAIGVVHSKNDPKDSSMTSRLADQNEAANSAGQTPPNGNNENSTQLDTVAGPSSETPVNAVNKPLNDNEASSLSNVSNHTSTPVASTSLSAPDATVTTPTTSTTTTSTASTTSTSTATISTASTISTTSTTTTTVPPIAASAAPPKQGNSKKIDIKTYYERTLQRRKSIQNEQNKLESSVTSGTMTATTTQVSTSTPKVAEADVKASKSISGSIKDPRLFYSKIPVVAVVCSTITDEGSTAQKNNVQPEVHQQTAESASAGSSKQHAIERVQVAESTTKHDDEGDGAVKKVTKRKLREEKPLAVSTNINPVTDVATTVTPTLPKPKQRSESVENSAEKNTQGTMPPDPKKFKNIRSECSKELKLKKEIARMQRAKKSIKSKPANSGVTKAHHSKEAEAKNPKKAEEQIEDIDGDTSKTSGVETESAALSSASSSEDTVISNDNTEAAAAKVGSGSPEDNEENEESPCNIETDGHPPSSDLVESKVANENVTDTASTDTTKSLLPQQITQSEEACDPILEQDTASVETAAKVERKITNKESAGEVAGESALELHPCSLGVSSHTGNPNNLPLSSRIKQSKTMVKLKIVSSDTSPTKSLSERSVENANSPASTKGHDSNDIPELDKISRLEGAQGKEHQPLADMYTINNNLDVSDINENDPRSDVTSSALKPANTDGHGSPFEQKIAEPSTAPSEKSEGQRAVEESVTSPESVGSPFKGFLQESIMSFEPPLFGLDIDEMNVDKEFTTDKEGSGSVPMAIPSKVDLPEKSPSALLHVSNTTEKQLLNEAEYAADTGLVVEESVFINEEEIPDEDAAKDLASKLTSATDPSLSDALDMTTSEEALRLPEAPSAEHLNAQIYLENDMSEKITCDKLPSFDENLENDMFYLDDRLPSTATFDNTSSAHFPDHPRSLQYDITSTITSEAAIAPCSDLLDIDMQKSLSKFDFKRIPPEISPTNNDLVGTSMEYSPTALGTPKTLNIRTKAALKEPPTNLFAKCANNILTPAEAAEEARPSETIGLVDETPPWQSNVCNVTTPLQENQNDATVTQEFSVCTGEISLVRHGMGDEAAHGSVHVGRSATPTSAHVDENLQYGVTQYNPRVELRKLKEIDRLMQKKAHKKAEKSKDALYKSRKRENAILHKLESRRMKYRSKWPHMKNLLKKLRSRQSERDSGGNPRDIILARMLEIDVQIHELTKEKFKLHEMLQEDIAMSNSASISNSAPPKTVENDVISARPNTSPALKSLLIEADGEAICTKINKTPSPSRQLSPKLSTSKQLPPKQLPSKQSLTKPSKKRSLSHSSEDEEVVRYTQRMKTPVIRWKKIPWLEQTQEAAQGDHDEDLEKERRKKEDQYEMKSKEQRKLPSDARSKAASVSADTPEKIVQKPVLDGTSGPGEQQSQPVSMKNSEKKDSHNIDESPKCVVWLDKKAAKDPPTKPRSSVVTEGAERSTRESDIDKKSDSLVPTDAPRASSQLSSTHVHSTPESASIYSDDSTWDSSIQNTAFELNEKKKSTGLALLEETFKKELAMSRKMKAMARKQKKKQLHNFLKRVNKLSMEEEELPLSKLYIRKLQQKRDLLDSLTKRKDDPSDDPKAMGNVEEVINAVAENRVQELYEGQCEAPISTNEPSTSTVATVPQPDKHRFYVDAEANANADWPSLEKEGAVEDALQRQESNDLPELVKPSSAFAVVNQHKKVTLYEERNVEPDSSVTPESRQSPDVERARSADIAMLRSFDIRVSVPKNLIKDDFNLELLQRLNRTRSNVAGNELVGSTTNAFITNAKKENKEHDQARDGVPQDIPQTTEQPDKDHTQEESEAKAPKQNQATDASDVERNAVACDVPKQEATGNVTDVQIASQMDTARFSYSDPTTENEDSEYTIINAHTYNKTVAVATSATSNSQSIVETNTKQRKPSAPESEHLSNDSTASRRNYQSAEGADVKERDANNSESNSRAFDEIQSNDRGTVGSPVPANSASEKSEESNEVPTIGKRSPDHIISSSASSTISFDKSMGATKSAETTKKLSSRKKYNKSEVVRRSSRYVNETTKPNKDDDNSNSSERQEAPERESRRSSKSPTPTIRDDKVALTTRKNRVAQKAQCTNVRRTLADPEPETKVDNPVKPPTDVTIAEPVALKNKSTIIGKKRKHTQWEMMNCKVTLIDCRHNPSKLNPEALQKLGIFYVGQSHLPNVSLNPDAAVVLERSGSSLDIFYEKPVTKNSDDLAETSTSHEMEIDELESARMQYTAHKGPILDIKVFRNSFLAASEDGKIYRYSQTSNGILNIYKGHKSAVTCLLLYKSNTTDNNSEYMYSGSLDGTLRCYNITSGALAKNPVQIHSPIQCMDEGWGTIFVGTKSGHVSRFHIKTGTIKGSSIQFSDTSVLALKATNEGPRKILIVASRNQPISIRDAQTGLFLRTISGQRSHTVYSLLLYHNLIYCGTSSTSINVFDFTLGEQTIQYEAGVGIVCMRIHEQLLFAGCYDGNIYVFDTRNHKLVCSIPGPGNMLLSIEVVNNKIIAGSKDKRLHSWQMPPQVRALLYSVT